jgi:hypothetical protein
MSASLKRKLGMKAPAKASSKTKEKPAPKRAKSSYFIFCDDERPKIQAETAGAGTRMSEISKVMSARWAQLTRDEKQKYEDLAEIEKEAFNESLPPHLVKLPTGWKRQTDASSKIAFYVHLPTKTCRWTRPRAADTPAPTVTQARNAYALFGVSLRQQAPDGAKISPKTISDLWKAASADTKAAFETKALADKDRYARDRATFMKTGVAPALEPIKSPEVADAVAPVAMVDSQPVAPVVVMAVADVVVPPQVVADVVAPPQVVADVVAPQQVVADVVVPPQVVADVVAPQQVVADVVAPQQVVADVVAPQQVVADVVPPQQVVADVVVPPQVVADVVAPQQVVADVVVPPQVVADVVAPPQVAIAEGDDSDDDVPSMPIAHSIP